MKPFDNTTPHLSSLYDEQILNTIPYYDRFHQEVIQIVQAAAVHPNIWLDTGAGTGTLVKSSVDVFPETLFLLMDPSEEMLAEAKKKLSEYGTGRVRILNPAPTQNLTLPPELRPDVITAIQAHHYLSPAERQEATQRCFEVLKEGGIFITFENIRPFTEKGIEISKEKWGKYQLSKGKSKEQIKNHLERFGTEYFPITIEEHLKLYRDCGFQIVEMLWFANMQAGFYCIK